MKKSIVVFSLLLLAGCSTLREQRDNYDACLNDPVCSAKVEKTVQATTSISGVVGGAMGHPMSGPLAVALSALTALIATVYYGNKKKKEGKLK